MIDRFHDDPYEMQEMAEENALRNGDCPDCGEKSSSSQCCTNQH